MRKVLLLGVCILLQLIAGECAAPGDEDTLCLTSSVSTGVTAPVYGPNQRPMMDTRHYKNLLESGGKWMSIDADGDRRRWGPGVGGQCQRVMRGCTSRFNTASHQQQNYAVSQYIRTGGAYEVIINVAYQFQCSGRNCPREFDLMLYETSEEGGKGDVSNYIILRTVSSRSNRRESITISVPLTSTGFYLALRENGTCVTAFYVAVHSFICPAKKSYLVYHPEVNAPPVNLSPLEINGSCCEHSSQLNGSDIDWHPSLLCGPRGAWLSHPYCQCNPGFWYAQEKERCNACPLHTFKSIYGNGQQQDVCIPCPKHSVSGEGATECKCKPTFYRTRDEGPDADCTTPPSHPLELTVDECTNTTITVSWKPPSNTGERPLNDVFYQVIYQRADSLHLGFNRATSNVGVTSYTVTELDPLTDYKIWVVSENSVSEEFLPNEDDMMLRSTVIDATTKAGVPEKITFFVKKHGNTFTWQPPKVTNGNVTGFDVRIYYKGHANEAVLVQLDNLDFCYSPLPTVLPPLVPGEVLCVQVRARTAQGPGPWSDDIPFDRDSIPQPTTQPTTEPLECPIISCDPPTVVDVVPDVIIIIMGSGDLVVWVPPGGEVEYYIVEIYYKNSRNKRKGIQIRILIRPWAKLSQDFDDRTLGVIYFFRVRTKNSAGESPWSDAKQLPFNN